MAAAQLLGDPKATVPAASRDPRQTSLRETDWVAGSVALDRTMVKKERRQRT